MLSQLAQAGDVVDVSGEPRDVKHRGCKGCQLCSTLGFSARNECDIIESLSELSEDRSDSFGRDIIELLGDRLDEFRPSFEKRAGTGDCIVGRKPRRQHTVHHHCSERHASIE